MRTELFIILIIAKEKRIVKGFFAEGVVRTSKIYLCGVRIDNLSMEEAVERGLLKIQSPCVAFTPNAVMLDACRREPSLARLLNRADLSLPDGAGVLAAAARKRHPLRERIAGVDFGEAILEKASKEHLRVFLLGGKRGVAQAASERLSQKYPGLKVCGVHSGYFQKYGEENAAVLRRINEANADILFVCFGFPAQEKWIAESLSALPHLRLLAGLGGSLDVWAGNVKRAPMPLQKLGLEWAWRMAHEPRRLKNLPALLRSAFWS